MTSLPTSARTCSLKRAIAAARGRSISPDLTRNDPSKQRVAGGPINTDVSGAEFYDTIFDIAPSHLRGRTHLGWNRRRPRTANDRRRGALAERYAAASRSVGPHRHGRSLERRREPRLRRDRSSRHGRSASLPSRYRRLGRNVALDRRTDCRAISTSTSCARIRRTPTCSTPDWSKAFGTRSIAARTGRICASTCRRSRCTTCGTAPTSRLAHCDARARILDSRRHRRDQRPWQGGCRSRSDALSPANRVHVVSVVDDVLRNASRRMLFVGRRVCG